MFWEGEMTSGEYSMHVEITISINPYNGIKSFNGQGASTMHWPGTELDEVYETNIGKVIVGLIMTEHKSNEYHYEIKGLSAAGPLLLL